jgi:hypothetical protein
MNIHDEYWFWVIRAISEPGISSRIHCYDKVENKLFSLTRNGEKFVPLFRNNTTQNWKTREALDEELKKFRDQEPSIQQLGIIPLVDKKSFLMEFSLKVQDESLKGKLVHETNLLTDRDTFEFKTDLKSESKSLYIEFDMKKTCS